MLPIQFGSLEAPLHGWYHPPTQGWRAGGVVICNPIGDDLVRAHRPLRHLAIRLASIGFPVMRFDYRGTGDSSGDERDPGQVAGWLADVHAAADELRMRTGGPRVVLVGLRVGATLAAVVAAGRDDVEAVISWSGFVTGAGFVDEAIRVHRMHRALEPHAFSGGPPATGGEEVLGFFLSDETMAALRALDLRTLPRTGRALVLAPGEIDKVTLALEGWRIERRRIPPDKFLIVPPHQGVLPEEALSEIVHWLPSLFPERTDAFVGPRAQRPTPLPGEEPLVIPGPRPLFGILHRPAAAAPLRPAIVLVNAGCVPRMGPHRQYVRLARQWVAMGFVVLRLDLSGIGDSPAAPGTAENVTYPPDRLDDLEQALGWVGRQTGAQRFVLVGLCSGADIAFAGAASHGRVTGLVLLNPRTFCVHDLDEVEAFKGARWYQDAVSRKESWMKLLRGQVDLLRVARTVTPKVIKMIGRKVRALRARTGGTDPTVPGRLVTLAERGVETLLVVAPHDPGVDYLDANDGAGMRALARTPGFRRVEIAGTDHTFTACWAQERVAAVIGEYLAAHHSGAPMRSWAVTA